MTNRENFAVGLDRRDPRFQVWRIGGIQLRLSTTQVRQVLALANKYLPEQERHTDGARVYLPPFKRLEAP